MAKLCHLSRTVRYSLRITFAVIGILLGVSAGFVFFLSYNNPHAATWALISAVFAAFTMCLHVVKYRDIEGTSLSLATHNVLLAVGIVGIFSGLAALIAYITKGISTHEHGRFVCMYCIHKRSRVYALVVGCFPT